MRERTFRNQLSRSVKSAREEQGLTQRTLAERAGITEKYLSRIELGLATPSVLVAFRVAGALGLGLDRLVAAPPASVNPGLAACTRILHHQPPDQLDRARRILVELFR
jgi:transcriptional regulator with XRE-family HTH domain